MPLHSGTLHGPYLRAQSRTFVICASYAPYTHDCSNYFLFSSYASCQYAIARRCSPLKCVYNFALTPTFKFKWCTQISSGFEIFTRIGRLLVAEIFSTAVRKSKSVSMAYEIRVHCHFWLCAGIWNRWQHNNVCGKSGPQFIAWQPYATSYCVVIQFFDFSLYIEWNDRENYIGKKHCQRH